MACYHSGLPTVIHKIWPWCQMEPQLMLSTVSLLSTYAAKCLTGKHNTIFFVNDWQEPWLWVWKKRSKENVLRKSMQLSYSYIFFSATSSLAYTSPSSTSTTQNARSSSQQLGANSLVHCLLKLAGRDNIKEPLLKALYGLLATLALSSECRNIMFKVSQLLQFVLLSFAKY